MELDIQPGELFLFPHRSRTALFEFLGPGEEGLLHFACRSKSSTMKVHPDKFLEMRNKPNGAIRVQERRPEQIESFLHIDPATFLDPEAPGLCKGERQRIVTLKKAHSKALTVQFFTKKYDESPGISKSEKGLNRFIRSHAAEARQLGMLETISASTLRRAIHNRGTPGDRTLHYFFDDRTDVRVSSWDSSILRFKAELIDEFWSPEKRRQTDVLDAFCLKLQTENRRLASLGVEQLASPSRETLRLWIRDAECYQRYQARHGARAAQRRFRGQQRAIQASRPLEYVMFDHTRVDAWANVEDENGKPILQERPWLMLAIDVYSRMILAAVLTYEPPSIYSVAMGLKQLVRPKDFLPAELRQFKNFGDGWGKPSFIIVDRAWENTEVSFQTMCESFGINVIWAPVRTPEFKCHVEYAFHLLNSILWHRLPSGIPHKPHVMAQLGLQPQKHADRNIHKMSDALWHAIRKLTFRNNEGLGMSPARAWQEGLQQHNRPMIDDVSAFDTFVGKIRGCQLSTSGIRLDNQRFHDPKITSALLNDLLRYAGSSKQRRAPNSSGTVHVHVTIDPTTCEYIHVWNPKTKRNVKLPNVLTRFSAGLSWREAKECREHAAKENLKFCSEDDMLEISAGLLASYERQIEEQPFREARKAARKYHARRPQLAPGTVVEESWEEPSATGFARSEVPHSIPANERQDDRRVIKSSRRGGVAATRKAMKTRAKNRQMRDEDAARSNQTMSSEGSKLNASSPWETVQDSAARLERLSQEL